ncbi:MAG TPA: tRNA (N(6)-L-threonylcarbamoyladenosine(37)-C(2))-methylthiotransferase MtaB [Clostridiales bacterium]|nr:tRNA (N(6)-L-threonylcarbamoyladenosine(37)-C(2))-methylthiotransferase MtaB [Clostridiales bacterium]
MEKSKKVAFVTLGCKVNQYESNAMAQKFIDNNYEICDIEDNPDIIIVNTCTVTNIADRKSRQLLRKAKDENPNAVVVACGCYVQVAKDKVDSIEEIDISIGNSEKKDIVQIVENYINQNEMINEIVDVNKEKDFSEMGLVTFTEKTRATIKIQDGCNNFCTYCLIPYARGRVRSRNKENIIKEVEEIAKKGIQEIVITGIHIASYGLDFSYNYRMIDLLEDLNKIDGIKRIRLGSLEPSLITDEFTKRLSKLDKICNHFHLSLQSGCDETLKRMNRKYTTSEFRQVVNRLRKTFKDVNLTTDIIVGFPGETEEEFETTYSFLKEIKFYKMHIFKYSPREGTPASKMPNQVDGKIKEERSQKLIELSDKNQEEYNKTYFSKPQEVLFEEQKDGVWTGYTSNYVKVSYKSDENLENKFLEI